MPGKHSPAIGMAMLNSSVMGAFNRTYSPIALSNEWSKVSRLMFVVVLCVIGNIMNGFFVATFFVEEKLSKKGNTFLALVGMADLIITAGVMPMSAVVLLSGQWDNPSLCHVLQFLAELSTYSYSIFFMLTAIENYCRLCCTQDHCRKFVNLAVNPGILLVYGATIAASAFGVYKHLDYDYCLRQHHGYYTFRAYTSIFFYLIPFIITVFLLLSTSLTIRKRGFEQVQYRRSQNFEDDYSRAILNILAYFLYAIAWIPYTVIVYEYPSTTDARFYQYAWLGISRSVVTSIFYSILNRDFRHAYSYLFNYCFCKNTVSGSYYSRNRRGTNAGTGDVRVNILPDAISPQRSAASRSRESLEL